MLAIFFSFFALGYFNMYESVKTDFMQKDRWIPAITNNH